ncbi:MAG: hypothetical protein J6U54_01250 [Clostridiales bacterium]|nr:hypothetical protein [Clostridiales bacterium]
MGKKFKMGRVVATRGVDERMQKDRIFAAFVSKSLRLYENCDWGQTCKEDKAQNNYAVDNGERILAVYEQAGVREPMKIWIITEWDRSVTTVLFPEEY